ncbi:hypothetical protein T439DRAFT_352296 [Meredithblackwellia eburnea MCA 4105]
MENLQDHLNSSEKTQPSQTIPSPPCSPAQPLLAHHADPITSPTNSTSSSKTDDSKIYNIASDVTVKMDKRRSSNDSWQLEANDKVDKLGRRSRRRKNWILTGFVGLVLLVAIPIIVGAVLGTRTSPAPQQETVNSTDIETSTSF